VRTFFAIFVSGLIIFPACAGPDSGSSGPLSRAGSGNVAGSAQGGGNQGGGNQGGTAGSAGTGNAGSGNAGTGGSGNAGTGNAGTGGSGNAGAGGSGNAGTGGSGATTCTSPSGLGPCDTWTQCGCNPGQMCQIRSTNGTTSCYPAGSSPGYSTCANSDSCGAGYDCVGGACQQYCDTAADCPTSFDECGEVGTDVGGTFTPIPGFRTCTRTCNPAAPQSGTSPFKACGAGLACLQLESGASTCTTAGTGAHRSACDGSLDCLPGLICVGVSATQGECRTGCMNIGGSCAGGETCVPLKDTVAGQQIGVCD